MRIISEKEKEIIDAKRLKNLTSEQLDRMGDFDELDAFDISDDTIELLEEITKTDAYSYEIVTVLGLQYAMRGENGRTVSLISKCYKDDELDEMLVILKAQSYIALDDYKKAYEFLKQYVPFENYRYELYYAYMNTLMYFNKNQEARKYCKMILNMCQEGIEHTSTDLIHTFNALIQLELKMKMDAVEKSVDNYIEFVKELEGTEQEQEAVAYSIVIFSSYQKNKTHREQFKRLLDTINKMNFIQENEFTRAIKSGYSSYESYECTEDENVSEFIKHLLGAFSSFREFNLNNPVAALSLNVLEKEQYIDLQHQTYLFSYFAAKRYPEILDELTYVKKNYPNYYHLCVSLEQELREDHTKVLDKYTKKILAIDTEESYDTPDQIMEYYDNVYTKNYKIKPVFDPNIRRNAPCPCGSGKKYKKCCGKL